jgi:hypothetical protein
MAEGEERIVKTVLQISLLRSYWPYLLFSLAGVADLAITLIGVRTLGLTEGNPRFTPFLTQTVIILYILLSEKSLFSLEEWRKCARQV